jgi:hypothetical protein
MWRSGSEAVGRNPKLGRGEHSDVSPMYYQHQFIFRFNKRTLIKAINAKACGNETNIWISLHMKSLLLF